METDRYSRYRKYYQNLGPLLQKPHVRAYTMVTLSFLLLSFLGAFSIRPAVTQIFELNRKISDRRIVNQKLDEKIKNLEIADREYKEIQNDLPVILAALPQESEFPSFLKSLEGIATSSATSMTELSFGEIDLLKKEASSSAALGQSSSPQSLLFRVGSSNSYLTFFDFLQRLERANRLVGIETLSVSPEKTGTQSGELKMGLTNRAYFLPNNLEENTE